MSVGLVTPSTETMAMITIVRSRRQVANPERTLAVFASARVLSGFSVVATLGLSTRRNVGGRVVCSALRVLHLLCSDGRERFLWPLGLSVWFLFFPPWAGVCRTAQNAVRFSDGCFFRGLSMVN